MKRITLLLFFILTTVMSFGQASFNGTISYSTPQTAWDGISADCSITIIGSTTQNGVYFEHNLHDLKIKSLRIRQKDISSSQIPSNVINEIKNDARIDVSFDLYVNNVLINRYGQPNVSWARLQRLPDSDGYKPATRENGYKLMSNGALSIRNVRIKSLRYRVNQTYYDKISKEIAGTGNKNSTNQNPATSGTSTSLTIEASDSQSESANSNTNSGDSNKESAKHILKPSDIGIPDDNVSTTSGNSNPMTKYNPNTNTGSSAVDNFNKGYQQGQQIADIATGIADLFTPTPAQLQRRADEAAANERKEKAERDIERAKKHETFEKYYLPLMDKAIKGDEQLRMVLYYASDNLWAWKYVPQRDEWLKQAFNNNNVFAILEAARMKFKDGKDNISLIQHAARAGSIDAMVELGNWFDRKSFTYKGIECKSGENAEYAIAAFTEAAEKGSPNAMYYLGMIYKYGITQDLSEGFKKIIKEFHITYNIAPDEKKAFEWFSKSLQPDYKYSIYAKAEWLKRGSYFESRSYIELAKMYKQGKVVPKDKAKAQELENSFKAYKSNYDKEF